MKDGKLDDLDYDILQLLSENSRENYSDIAEKLSKSHLTVKKHMDELFEAGIIEKYTIDINYEKLGYDIIALIELTIDKGKMLEVEEEISTDPNVFGVFDITGEYDAIVLVRFKTRKELSEMVKRINSYEHVIRTNTHLILNVKKKDVSFEKLLQYERSQSKKK
ncbi:MAG: Lrp/AsnC family transcriptional regulator [Promethearchaeota archaeon]|nr:MAG: Lrp/AsnC family transcriptional regulator [Candidatus Lokiarchaeota archaeon]